MMRKKLSFRNSLKDILNINEIDPVSVLVLVILLFGFLFLIFGFFKNKPESTLENHSIFNKKEVGSNYSIINISNKPPIKSIVSKNPFFEKYIERSFERCYKPVSWKSDQPICLNVNKNRSKRKFVILHPVTREKPRRLHQEVYLEEGRNYYLHFGVTNVADKKIFTNGCPGSCADSLVKIKIKKKDKLFKVFSTVVNSREPFRNYTLNVTDFAGFKIKIIAEGHAGGPCMEWCGESSAISNFFVYHS